MKKFMKVHKTHKSYAKKDKKILNKSLKFVRSAQGKKALKMFLSTLTYFRWILDLLIHKIFGLFYNSKKRVVPAIENSILLESVVTLSNKIQLKIYSVEDVVSAFIERSKEVNSYINAIVDERYEEALKEARQLDEDIAEGKITDVDFKNKPLLGIPFTSKDSTACEGMIYSFGILSRKEKRAKEDADVIKQFKSAGAILIATTSVPEVNMWQETRNFVIGQTCNPYDTTRTTGGSSGGEASLIASCGSPMGVGTDIGGSIRMPAYFCGVFGHKPTSDLISTKGLTDRTGKEKGTMVVAGPICRYAADITPMFKVLLGEKENLLKLDEEVDIHTVNFYYMDEILDARSNSTDAEIKAVVKRVVTHLDNTIKNADNIPKKVRLEEMKYMFRLWRHKLSKEEFNFALTLGNKEYEVNVWIELAKKLMGKSEFTFGAIVNLLSAKFPKENPEWAEQTLKKMKDDILEKLGTNGVLLYPSYNRVSNYHYEPFFRPYDFSSWAIFNALHLPVTQVPLGLNIEGLPIGIQVVSAPFNDHLCIAVAKELEKEFGGWVPIKKND